MQLLVIKGTSQNNENLYLRIVLCALLVALGQCAHISLWTVLHRVNVILRLNPACLVSLQGNELLHAVWALNTKCNVTQNNVNREVSIATCFRFCFNAYNTARIDNQTHGRCANVGTTHVNEACTKSLGR